MADEILPEEWRPVVGMEDRYAVSRLSRVRDATGRYVKHVPTRRYGKPSYTVVYLHDGSKGKNRPLHQIVAAAFCGPRPEEDGHGRIEVNHKDGDKTNNRSDNLEYTTRRGNAEHAGKTGLMATGDRHCSRTHPERIRRGVGHPRAKITAEVVRAIREAVRQGQPHRTVAAAFGVCKATVSHIVTGRQWGSVT